MKREEYYMGKGREGSRGEEERGVGREKGRGGEGMRRKGKC